MDMLLKEHRKVSSIIQPIILKQAVIENISDIELIDYTLDYNNNLVTLYKNIMKRIGLENVQIVGEEISDGKYNIYYINTNNSLNSEMMATAWDSCITIEYKLERVIKELGYRKIADRKVG